MIFEAGLNRNISIRLNGNSRITINDEYDLLDLIFVNGSRNGSRRDASIGNYIDTIPTQSLTEDVAAMKLQIIGVAGLDGRLRRLQNRLDMEKVTQFVDYILCVSNLGHGTRTI